ncbi:MAG TPA: S46 family peptidase [Bacteroidaceae bacterium]|nr:S46 family peptidase [Bacteroidaceae bacterium]
MKKILTLSLLVLFSLQIHIRADEGMWLLNMLEHINMDDMSELGLELTADQIYSINNTSLKDAVGALDGGSCTAELISPDGLLITNHHCAYEEIQFHSSLENNYLADGFWAMTGEEELPNENKSISFLIRMEEVTDRVLEDVTEDLSEDERLSRIFSVSQQIELEATQDNHYEAAVRSMFKGNRYFLFVMETFYDIRLVGVPPESIGKFGADTDNWVWPRHTGDFALFRVYTGPDGKPASYNPDNIPLKSKHYLPISLKGYEKGDFAMVLGFPGRTYRYFTSFEVEELLDVEHPNVIKIRGIKQDLMMEDMMANEKVKIQYAYKYYTRSTNYWKYSIGQSEGLKRLNVIDKKKEEERAFTEWIEKDPGRLAEYGDLLGIIGRAVEERKDYVNAQKYMDECIYLGMESVALALEFLQLKGLLMTSDPGKEEVKAQVADLKEVAANFYKDYNMPTDKKVMTSMIRLIMDDIPSDYQPSFISDINKKFKGRIDKYVDMFFKKSIFPNEAEMNKFLENPSGKVLDKDPAMEAVLSFLSKYREMMGKTFEAEKNFAAATRGYMKGRLEMYPEKNLYPDANSTMRFTHGTVGDYKPRDAVYYDYFTTLKGVMEKENPENPEFIVPEKLKKLYKAEEYGPYGENGVMNVCFTTNNDITGGNSGSPVINGKGELIGIAFDGNWEAMSGDVAFETELQKCINVDIRYVLFIIDLFAGAGHLIDEMMLVR